MKRMKSSKTHVKHVVCVLRHGPLVSKQLFNKTTKVQELPAHTDLTMSVTKSPPPPMSGVYCVLLTVPHGLFNN